MRSLRLAAAILALALVAAACSDDSEDDGEPSDEAATTTPSVSPTTSQPPGTTPTTVAVNPPTTTVVELVATTSTTEPPESGSAGTDPPPAPANLKCLTTGTNGEVLVEFDALSNPEALSGVRPYLGVDGGPMINQGFRLIADVNKTREGGTRWAVPVRSVPVGVALRLAVGSFNLLDQESGWWPIEVHYDGPGQSCGTPDDVVLPPATCTAGCDEEEGEPGA